MASAPEPLQSNQDSKRPPPPSVKLHREEGHVTMDNGILQVTFSTPDGKITGIKYQGIANLLETHNTEDDRGYWDLDSKMHYRFSGTKFTVIKEDPDQVELSFSRTWNKSLGNKYVPLNIDTRFVLLRDSPGFYSYAIFEHSQGWPDLDLYQIRIVLKLNRDKFNYMAISNDRQRIMPTQEDHDHGKPLAYKEAVILTNPKFLKGEVDDKYQYSAEHQYSKVHGWVSLNDSIGFWTITPSNEFQSNGPFKQDLTSHAGPTTLAMFHSTHYTGEDVGMNFRNGEYWKKVFGPIFFYVNKAGKDDQKDPKTALWADAKRQMLNEIRSWPYNFPGSQDYLYSKDRGVVTGTLLVLDRFVSKNYIAAGSAYVGLALPGVVGSWQNESKGYQFWTRADAHGYFELKNVRPGNYNIYAYVRGFIGDYKSDISITIKPGSNIALGNLVYKPPRDGPTLWEIGIADRSAAEFYIPDPKPIYVNKLYSDTPHSVGRSSPDKFRQYGLWERYTDLYPKGDLVYKVGVSNYSKDWFYSHVIRKTEHGILPTTWQILFQLDQVNAKGRNYKLRIALASATYSDLQVRVNDPKADQPLFQTGQIGKDNAIARHGIHGLYWLFQVDIPSGLLRKGFNTIYLTQSKHYNIFTGLMYDYIRLEGPA